MALVVRSKIKDVVKNMRISGDFMDALDDFVEAAVKKAAERAEANGRATVRPNDL